MNNLLLMWLEVGFNVLYLVLIWGLVILMRVRFHHVKEENRQQANFIWVAFFSLALGDTFHVGARTVAYFLEDGLRSTVSLFGTSFGLVGWSSLITAVMVTMFYLFLLVTWILRNQNRVNPFVYSLFTVAGIRLGLLVLPENQWHRPVPAQPWAMIRNLPLLILGIGVAVLYLRSSLRKKDRQFLWFGILILVSFLVYVPVVVYVQVLPLLGMLMIPKTLAYLAMGALAYSALFRGEAAQD